MDQQLLFLLSAIGVLNGFLVAIYFIGMSKGKQGQNLLLGLLFLALSIRIGKSVIFYFDGCNDYIGLYLQIGISACFLIGPLLYWYFRQVFAENTKSNRWKYELLFMGLLIGSVGCFYPYFEYLPLWLGYLMNLIYLQWITYLILTARLLYQQIGLLPTRTMKWGDKNSWLLSVFWGNALTLSAYLVAGLTSYILGAISFSFILYILIFLMLVKANGRKVILETAPKYGGKVMDVEQANHIIQEVMRLFNQEAVYQNPELKLQEVAATIGVTTNQLSRAINEKLAKNFSQLLHEYRIEKAKTMIQQEHHYTLEGIGYECGYKAKSTFYTAFKKYTGTTPAQFKKTIVG